MTRPHRLISLLALLLAPPALAAIITVSPDGPLTIQEAIDQASDGDVVELLDGVYTGGGNRDINMNFKAITLRSASGDPQVCIIDAEGSQSEPHRGLTCWEIEHVGMVVEGITFTGGWRTDAGGGVDCVNASPTIRNCRFVGNHSQGDGGGLVVGEAAHVVGCWFEGNSAAAGGGASTVNHYGDDIVFERCTFVDNEAVLWGGGHRT